MRKFYTSNCCELTWDIFEESADVIEGGSRQQSNTPTHHAVHLLHWSLCFLPDPTTSGSYFEIKRKTRDPLLQRPENGCDDQVLTTETLTTDLLLATISKARNDMAKGQ